MGYLAMQDSRSNWMEGYLCMSVYLIIAVAVSQQMYHSVHIQILVAEFDLPGLLTVLGKSELYCSATTYLNLLTIEY